MTAELVLQDIVVNWLFYYFHRMTIELQVLRSHKFTFLVHQQELAMSGLGWVGTLAEIMLPKLCISIIAKWYF